MKRFLGLLAVAFIGFGLAAAEQATVNHGVSLRGDPSTQSLPIGHLNRGTPVTLLAHRPRRGFYHIQLEDGTRGWVGVRYLTVESGDGAQPTNPTNPTNPANPTNPTSTNPTSDADLLNMLFAAHTTAVGQPLVVNGQNVCGPEGDATAQKIQALNDNKNRTDPPSSYVSVGWDQLKNLPADRVNDLQGAAVSVVGYLSHKVNVEKGESTNCHLLAPNEVDWHIYLTNSPNQQISDAIIVEATPRVRPQHKWTTTMLAPLVNSNTQVRISGWLAYDFEHLNVVGTQRATVWEVHPITKIEVLKNGQWVDLESNP